MSPRNGTKGDDRPQLLQPAEAGRSDPNVRDVTGDDMPVITFTRSSLIETPVEALRDWHFEPGAFERLSPPWERVRLLEGPDRLCDGAIVVLEVRIGPFRSRWVASHELTPDGFIDRQLEGPFASWEHHHLFESVDAARSRLTDSIRCELPLGPIGWFFGKPLVERKLDRLFSYRHRITAESLSGTAGFHSTSSSDAR